MWRFLLGLAVAAGVALVAAGVVPGGNPGREKIARTAAGNAQAQGRGAASRRSRHWLVRWAQEARPQFAGTLLVPPEAVRPGGGRRREDHLGQARLRDRQRGASVADGGDGETRLAADGSRASGAALPAPGLQEASRFAGQGRLGTAGRPPSPRPPYPAPGRP